MLALLHEVHMQHDGDGDDVGRKATLVFTTFLRRRASLQ